MSLAVSAMQFLWRWQRCHIGAEGGHTGLNELTKKAELTVEARNLSRLYWLGILGGCLLLSLLTTAQRYFLNRSSAGGPGFLLFFCWSAMLWLFWAGLAPVIFWLGRRLPLRRGTLLWALPAHFSCAVFMGLLHLVYWTALSLVFDYAHSQSFRFWDEFVRLLQVLFYVEVILYSTILGAGLARAALREAHEREVQTQALEAQLRQAQLLALKQQLQPHFLFNALNTVAMMVRNGENQQAVQMIAGISELLRWSLSETTAQEVSLAAELEAAQRYLAIEQFRFPDRLRVEINVPSDLRSASVPNLILQPLVENAVRHGIARSSAASLVRISALRQGAWLELSVEDDGAGFLSNWQPGVGLRNVRERLAQAYGTHAELQVEACDPHGARVRLSLPCLQHTTYGKDQNSHRR